MCCEGVCEGEGTVGDSYMLRYLTGWPLSSPDLMISALGTCRLSGRLKIFFKHQLSGGEIKQIIWQAVYIFRSIRSGERCRRAARLLTNQGSAGIIHLVSQSRPLPGGIQPRLELYFEFLPLPAFIITMLGLGNISNKLYVQCTYIVEILSGIIF